MLACGVKDPCLRVCVCVCVRSHCIHTCVCIPSEDIAARLPSLASSAAASSEALCVCAAGSCLQGVMYMYVCSSAGEVALTSEAAPFGSVASENPTRGWREMRRQRESDWLGGRKEGRKGGRGRACKNIKPPHHLPREELVPARLQVEALPPHLAEISPLSCLLVGLLS